MKKSYLYILVLLAGFSSCSKDDGPVFTQSADERVAQLTKAYQDQLTGSANGWKGLIYPAGGGAYSFYFKFNNQNRVNMLSAVNLLAGKVSSSILAPYSPSESSIALRLLRCWD